MSSVCLNSDVLNFAMHQIHFWIFLLNTYTYSDILRWAKVISNFLDSLQIILRNKDWKPLLEVFFFISYWVSSSKSWEIPQWSSNSCILAFLKEPRTNLIWIISIGVFQGSLPSLKIKGYTKLHFPCLAPKRLMQN